MASGDANESRDADEAVELLQRATDELLDAQTEAAVAEVAVDAAADVLELPYSVVWYPDDERDALAAAAVSDALTEYVETPDRPAESMTHGRGTWLWDAYTAESPYRMDVAAEDTVSATPAHGGIAAPIGEYGVLTAGRADTDRPTEWKVRLAGVLAQTMRAVLSRTEREREAERQRDALELLNRMVRHDIRNDLQLVMGHVERLDAALDDDHEAAEQALRRTDSAVQRTETARDLTDAMLNPDAEPEPVPLRPVVRARLEEVRATHDRATVRVDGSIPDVTVRADDMLGSVVTNLVENAIRHNDDDPTVVVSATERDGGATVRVADDGPGVPDAVADSLFEAGEMGARSDGTGVGLSLVETLVERYDGDVWLADDPSAEEYPLDSVGAVFSFALPTAD